MKFNKITLIAIASFTGAISALADGDHGAPSGVSRFGADKAVTAFSPEEGFKLADATLSNLGIRFTKITGPTPWTVSKSAVVRIKHVSGVYRRLDGWISFVLVAQTNKGRDLVAIRSEDLQSGDEIATEGAAFLRLTEADLNSDTIDSCAN